MREEEKNTSQKSKFQRILKKRWTLPAIYISSAAIILAAAFWAQNSTEQTTDNGNKERSAETGKSASEPSLEVNAKLENIKMPVADESATVIKKEFYDKNADKDAQAAALIHYNNRYEPNKGIDIAAKDGKEFDVLASLSGYVTKVEEDSLNGNLVEVEHDNGVVTRYQSIKDIQVKAGDQVKQGDKIASAAQSLINEEAGTHVHFEIRKDGVAVNPISYIEKQVTSIESETPASSTEKDAEAIEESKKSGTAEEAQEDSSQTEEPAADDAEKTEDPASGSDSSDTPDPNAGETDEN